MLFTKLTDLFVSAVNEFQFCFRWRYALKLRCARRHDIYRKQSSMTKKRRMQTLKTYIKKKSRHALFDTSSALVHVYKNIIYFVYTAFVASHEEECCTPADQWFSNRFGIAVAVPFFFFGKRCPF